MLRMMGITAACALALCFSNSAQTANADDAALSTADRVLQSIDIILQNHVHTPTRQELLLHGIRGIIPNSDLSLVRAVSDVEPGEETRKMLAGKLREALVQRNATFDQLESEFLMAAVNATPAAGYQSGKEFAVQRQVQENRYVGIGIVLAVHENLPQMREVIRRGPAHVAGGRDGDLMISIDGDDASKMDLATVVQLLRGQEGKPVTIVVRQPDSEETRTLDIVRGEVPFESVVGRKRLDSDDWDFRADEEGQIAFVHINGIRGSTAHELKMIARTLHNAGFQALVLDLRMRAGGDLRHTAMVADELLGETTIGSTVIRGQHRDYTSSADALFSGWPMAVLIDEGMRGPAEWIAAALQDSGRAVLVGQTTAGDGFIHEFFDLPNGDVIILRTGVMQRSSGEALAELSANPRRVLTLDGLEHPAQQSVGVAPDHPARANRAVDVAVALLKKQLDGTRRVGTNDE